jgi:hypothetical protein
MKMLICGECSTPLTTVAQGLNRLRSEQMRSELLPGTAAPSARYGTQPFVEDELPATSRVTAPVSVARFDSI